MAKLGMLCLVIAVVLTGLWFILLKKASDGVAPVVVQTLHVSGTALALVMFILFRDVELVGTPWRWGAHWYLAVIAGMMIGTANIFMFLAFQSVPVSIVVPLLNLSCLIPIFFGLLVWKEKINVPQGIGIALAVVALLLITYPYRAVDRGDRDPPSELVGNGADAQR